jgi:hypothetical protein
MSMLSFFHGLAAVTLTLCASLPALGNSLTDGTANAAVQWNDAAVTAIKTTGTPPTVGSRALFIVHSAMYDAWAAYDAIAVGSIPGTPPRQPASAGTVLNKTSAISYAAYRTLLDLFPTQANVFTMLMINLGFDPSIKVTDPTTAAGVGNAAAANQIAFRHADGSNQLGDLGGNGPYSDYTGYVPVNFPETMNDPNHWQPLRAANGVVQQFLSPQWGLVTPFALAAANQFRPGPPPQAGTWLYQQRMRDAMALNASLDDRSKMSGEYWNDATGTSETPPGHWNRIAEDLSNRDKNSLDRDVQLYFVLNAVLHDTSVALWEAKRFYDYIRPVSAIHYFYQGQTIQGWGGPGMGTVSLDGSAWLTWIGTPPHPEYPSGHSAYSNGAADVLRRFTASDTYVKSVTFAAGSSVVDPGTSPQSDTTLSWLTFSEVAEDAGFSREIDGIHFKESVFRSAALGRQVAVQVWNRYAQLINGGQ